VLFALRRVLGRAPALLAALLLALNPVQVWFAAFRSRRACRSSCSCSACWRSCCGTARVRRLRALAGFALGLTLLVRIDSLLVVLPLGLYLLVRRAHHDLPWRTALPLLLPFGALAFTRPSMPCCSHASTCWTS